MYIKIKLKRRDAEFLAAFFKKNRSVIENLGKKPKKSKKKGEQVLEGIVDQLGEAIDEINDIEETLLEEEIVDTFDEVVEEINEIEDDLLAEGLFDDDEEDDVVDTFEEVVEEINEIEEDLIEEGLLDDDEEEQNEVSGEDELDEFDIVDMVDDLTVIKGLGAKTVEKLAAHGIETFQQLVDLSEEKIEELDGEIRRFKANFEKKEWRQQAANLVE
jgi:predicted flap endonuclease-1-like 5' DNA nuclease